MVDASLLGPAVSATAALVGAVVGLTGGLVVAARNEHAARVLERDRALRVWDERQVKPLLDVASHRYARFVERLQTWVAGDMEKLAMVIPDDRDTDLIQQLAYYGIVDPAFEAAVNRYFQTDGAVYDVIRRQYAGPVCGDDVVALAPRLSEMRVALGELYGAARTYVHPPI